MRILGVDPGYGRLGWAIIEHNLKIIDFGAIVTNQKNELDERLLEIHQEINNIINKFKPECMAIERLFFAKNTKTAIDVAKCIGVILLTTRLSGLQFHEYSPPQVKKAITGYGRATKKQIQNMIMRIFKIGELPRPDDAADALAIATCHTFNLTNYRKNVSL